MGEGGDEGVGRGRGQADCMFVHNSGHPQFFLYLHVACKETGKVNLKNIYILMTTNYIEGYSLRYLCQSAKHSLIYLIT